MRQITLKTEKCINLIKKFIFCDIIPKNQETRKLVSYLAFSVRNEMKFVSHLLVSNPSVARVLTQHWTRRFIHVCRFECIYWTIWGRASKPRGDNFARRVAQLSASAKYVTLMVIIPLSLRLTVTSVTRNIALIPWCAQPLCDTYKCSPHKWHRCARRDAHSSSVPEEYLNALANALPDFLVKRLL